MPQVVNGCGTWYYGKKNVQTYQGVCSTCKCVRTLTSYDTRLYVVVVFIPIIPLGRKRIIEKCSACTRHRVMPLSDWQEAQRRAQETIKTYRRSPRDANLAEAALQYCGGYRDQKSFYALAPELEGNFGSDPKILRLIAAAYDLFGDLPNVERMLYASLAAQDDDETREAIADCLLRQGRPEEAEPYLQHVIDDGIPDRVNSLFTLAQGYQAKGEHEKALSLYDACQAINPMIAQDPVFIELREASVVHRGTGRPVQPGKIAKKVKSRAAWRKFRRIAPAALGIAILAYLSLAWMEGRRCAVYLVNGIDRPYSVDVNGVRRTLDPQSATKIRVPEGSLKIEIVDPPGIVPAQAVTLKTSFLTRPFSNHTFVVNPDGAAILRRTRAYYGGGDRSPESEFFGGQTLLDFRGLDFVFEKFPDSIHVDSHSGETHRDGVFLATQGLSFPPVLLLQGLTEELGKEGIARIAAQRLLLEPDKTDYLGLLAAVMPRKELISFLRRGISRRPVIVQWHRFYQHENRGIQHEQEVKAEYEAMLAADPQNTSLMYLTGRTCTNPDQRRSLYEKAMQGQPSCPYAAYALGFNLMAEGKFAEAVPLMLKALEQLPNDPIVRYYGTPALLAAGEYDKLLAILRADRGKPMPTGYQVLAEEIYIQTVAGHKEQAAAAIQTLGQRLKEWTPQAAAGIMKRVEAIQSYVNGNVADFIRVQKASPNRDDRFAAHLSAGQLAEAEKEFPERDEGDDALEKSHLLVWLLADGQKNEDRAATHLKAAIELLSAGNFEDRAFAAALKGTQNGPGDEVLHVSEDPVKKAIILTVIGQRQPDRREACFALARRLNFDRRFPHHLLAHVLESQPSP